MNELAEKLKEKLDETALFFLRYLRMLGDLWLVFFFFSYLIACAGNDRIVGPRGYLTYWYKASNQKWSIGHIVIKKRYNINRY